MRATSLGPERLVALLVQALLAGQFAAVPGVTETTAEDEVALVGVSFGWWVGLSAACLALALL
jgi:hypothetical protein